MLVILGEHSVMETTRLILRPITLEDTADLNEYASSIENTVHVFPTHLSIDETKEVIAAHYLNAPLGKYAIELKNENKLIGTIDLRINQKHKTGEIGYALNLDYSGKGYMTEAGNQILKLAFEHLKLHQVKASHSTINPKSGQVMHRLGMEKIGVLPKNRVHKEKIVDDVIYVITDEKYKKIKQGEIH